MVESLIFNIKRPSFIDFAKPRTYLLIMEQYKYLPFGKEMAKAVIADEVSLFAGYIRDLESGIDYLNSRYYYTMIYRFLTADSINGIPEIVITWNRYLYSRCNPLKFIDSTGQAERITKMICSSDSVAGCDAEITAGSGPGYLANISQQKLVSFQAFIDENIGSDIQATLANATIKTIIDLATGTLDMLRAGEGIGLAIGDDKASIEYKVSLISQDIGRISGIIMTVGGASAALYPKSAPGLNAGYKMVVQTKGKGMEAIHIGLRTESGTNIIHLGKNINPTFKRHWHLGIGHNPNKPWQARTHWYLTYKYDSIKRIETPYKEMIKNIFKK